MDSIRKTVIAVVCMAVVSLAIACVAASPQTSDTPLYTVRMEQASSKMNFLPTEMNGFTYMTEKGYNLNYNSSGCCGDQPMVTSGKTCEGTCIEETCDSTCPGTCGSTCGATCGSTCGSTCNTCPSTCDTCGNTCVGPTCPNTCLYTCGTCDIGTCSPTCLGC